MKKFIIPALLLAPAAASAQLTGVSTFLDRIGSLVDKALPIVVALALLGFFWGLMKFVFSQGNEEAKKGGTSMMIWSIVALFVMVSVWGLVGFIGKNLGFGQGSGNNPTTVPVPRVPTR